MGGGSKDKEAVNYRALSPLTSPSDVPYRPGSECSSIELCASVSTSGPHPLSTAKSSAVICPCCANGSARASTKHRTATATATATAKRYVSLHGSPHATASSSTR